LFYLLKILRTAEILFICPQNRLDLYGSHTRVLPMLQPQHLGESAFTIASNEWRLMLTECDVPDPASSHCRWVLTPVPPSFGRVLTRPSPVALWRAARHAGWLEGVLRGRRSCWFTCGSWGRCLRWRLMVNERGIPDPASIPCRWVLAPVPPSFGRVLSRPSPVAHCRWVCACTLPSPRISFMFPG
jgi:hypothetical protein